MSIWSQAKDLAAQTPEDRNRYVDFLRAVSILVVITGHWLIAAMYYVDGQLIPGDMLSLQPNTQYLTWIFQVMPIFFFVGGYSNAVSLESAERQSTDYANWLVTRLNRLVSPLLVLLLAWAGLALVLHLFGVRTHVIGLASRAALIPIWFLAIYIMVVVLAPLTYKAWQRYGYWSLVGFAALGILVDILFFAAHLTWLGWSNYFWVWLSVHQLGYGWREGRLASPPKLAAFAFVSVFALWALIYFGPYPLAMVGSPDEALSNTLPPKITLLALGLAQFGLLLSLESPARKLLSGLRTWTATVLINSMIMTVYLWHLTVMVILVALAFLLDGLGLRLEPGTTAWWWSRPLWILVLYGALLPLALVLSPFERRSLPKSASTPSALRLVAGAILIGAGVALIALFGFGGAPVRGLEVVSFVFVFSGAALAGILRLPKKTE